MQPHKKQKTPPPTASAPNTNQDAEDAKKWRDLQNAPVQAIKAEVPATPTASVDASTIAHQGRVAERQKELV